MPNQTEYRARRTGQIGELRFVPARGRYVLDQIVAANGKEVGMEVLNGKGCRRHLDHHAERRHLRFAALATQVLDGLLEKGTAAIKFLWHRDHRNHYLEIASHCSAGQRPQLRAKDVQMPQ